MTDINNQKQTPIQIIDITDINADDDIIFELTDEITQITPYIMLNFDFDFDFYKIKCKKLLTNIIYNMFEELFFQSNQPIQITNINIDKNNLNLDKDFFDKIDKIKLYIFIKKVANFYNDNNSFHNFSHATNVVNFIYLIIKTSDINKYVDKQNLFALMISALIHDIDHPGNTNKFEINSKSFLSRIYNDNSILENYHCFLGFYLMELPSINLLNKLSDNEYKNFRKIIIKSVLATDLTYHKELLIELYQLNDYIIKIKENNINNINYLKLDLSDQITLCKGLISAADLSNPTKSYDQCFVNVSKLQNEFSNQIIKESLDNLLISNYLLCKNDKDLFLNELHFCDDIVLPLYQILCLILPTFDYLINKIKSNADIWFKLYNL
jgi:hypothetical protein